MDALPILLERNRIFPGIDYSGDQFKAVKPLRLGDEEKMQLSKKTDNYLKAREAFLNPKKQKKK